MLKYLLLFLAVSACVGGVLGSDLILTYLPRILGIDSRSLVERNCCGLPFRLGVPQQYGEEDDTLEFPLVVYLHGAGERGTDNRSQAIGLTQVGNGFNRQARAFRKRFPSFVLVPQCPIEKTWADDEVLDALVQTIEEIKDAYPIDASRLYLIGYSMGGSGTYSLAARYFRANSQQFAGIIRLAGQGLFDRETHDIVSKSAVWLHVGLKDDSLRIDRAREAFDIIRENRRVGTVTTEDVTIEKHPGVTSVLTVGNREVARFTEYEADGHSISGFPFEDPMLLNWLFEQRIR